LANARDVAKASGVSVATVSYILNNKPINIRPETRARVLQAMRDLDYRATAAPKRHKHTRLDIGVVFANAHIRLLEQPYFNQMLDGIVYTGTIHHHNITLFCDPSWGDVRKSLRLYCDGRCDGLLLLGPDLTDGLVDAILERGLPFVMVNSGALGERMPSVDIDHDHAGYLVGKYLCGRGHRRIAILPGESHKASSIRRVEGCLRALKDEGNVCPDGWMPPGCYNWESGYARTKELFARGVAADSPTALFCCNDAIAQGAYIAFRELNIHVPADVSVIGFDDVVFAEHMDPPLTTVRQPLQQIGERATDILIDQIRQEANRRTVQKEVFPVEIMERASVSTPRDV
jgi:LacI family transcriptional regulator